MWVQIFTGIAHIQDRVVIPAYNEPYLKCKKPASHTIVLQLKNNREKTLFAFVSYTINIS